MRLSRGPYYETKPLCRPGKHRWCGWTAYPGERQCYDCGRKQKLVGRAKERT